MTVPDSGRPERDGPGMRHVLLLAAGAVALRLLLLLGRGDYLAFDEGWYLLLARSLFTGDGYSLIGTPHVALSPLFPLLAGAAGAALDSWVWGGRIVAAAASGLVVIPAWALFQRLATRRTAFIGAILVAVLPSLAPFTVPFWIGADLWVGAEPLLHLFLYAGVALWLNADEDDRSFAWLASGAVFGLAFLSRPEAIITWGLLGLVALGLAAIARAPRRLVGAVLMALGFLMVAAPYWLYIHDVSGQWSVTGRGVGLPTVSTAARPARSSAARTIERMLWEDDEAYRDRLYGLDDTGLRLRSDYWGVAERQQAAPSTARGQSGADGAGAGTPGAETAGERPSVEADASGATPGAGTGPDAPTRTGQAAARPDDAPSPLILYVRSMGRILPLLLWLFVVLGAIGPRAPGILRRELPVAGALVGTSVAIAAVVAVDPRTQLFLAPLLALYAARGFSFVEDVVQQRFPDAGLRPGFVRLLLTGTAVVWMLAINGRRLYLSLSVGSPHHVVAAQNRDVAEELDSLLGAESGPLASWHPAIAVYADRDWRVLPYADLPVIVRYLDGVGARALVLSAYYPPDLGVEDLDTRYLILPVPETGGELRSWQLRLLQRDTIRAVGRLEPVGEGGEEP